GGTDLLPGRVVGGAGGHPGDGCPEEHSEHGDDREGAAALRPQPSAARRCPTNARGVHDSPVRVIDVVTLITPVTVLTVATRGADCPAFLCRLRGTPVRRNLRRRLEPKPAVERNGVHSARLPGSGLVWHIARATVCLT